MLPSCNSELRAHDGKRLPYYTVTPKKKAPLRGELRFSYEVTPWCQPLERLGRGLTLGGVFVPEVPCEP